MSAKSIIDVVVNDEQFKQFNEMFQMYRKHLEDMPEDWEQITESIGKGAEEMEGFSGFSKTSRDALLIAAIQADAITKAIRQSTGAQEKLNTKTKDGAIQMGKMAKFSKEMHKDVSKMSSIYLKLGALGASALAIPTSLYMATSQLAGQNLQARGLGLKIGQTQAFGANFEKFGLGASDLGNVANAQGDVSKWRAFIAAGLTPQQIQNEDAEQLTYDFARAASGKYREWQKAGMPAASMAQAYGFTDVLSLQQLRTGASYTDQQFIAAQNKTLADSKANEVNQGIADQASDVKAALKSDWAKVLNTFNEQLSNASPELKALSDSAAAAAVNLLKVAGPEAKKVLAALEGPPVSRAQAAKEGGVIGGLATAGYWMRDKWAALTNSHLVTPTDSLASMVDAQYTIESGRGKHLLSPKGAMGPMQFMKPTWDEWGRGDVNNLQDSQDAARRYDTFLLKRYGGDVRKALAAYNWGMGNLDKDVAKNGANWESHAPQETQQYINKAVSLMARQGQNVNINITNSTAANVATSMNAAPH
jgi:hypothetical protein